MVLKGAANGGMAKEVHKSKTWFYSLKLRLVLGMGQLNKKKYGKLEGGLQCEQSNYKQPRGYWKGVS